MWQIALCLGFVFLILEIFTPSMFFLNFAISAFICAVLALFITNSTVLISIFAVLSLCLLIFLRPFILKKRTQESGVNATYIGKSAKVIEDIDKNNGAISIYDERWQARTLDDEVITTGEMVEIVDHKSIIMYVKKLVNKE